MVKGGAGGSPADGRTAAGTPIGTTCDATGGATFAAMSELATLIARDDAGACDFGTAGDAALPSVFGLFAAGAV